jgi:hypothetical protein
VAERALTSSRERQERGFEAWALRLLAEIVGAPGSPRSAAAEDLYRQALALAERLAMRPLAAHCHLGLGRLHARAGDEPRSLEHLTTAAGLYREMDMPFWLEQAEAARPDTG